MTISIKTSAIPRHTLVGILTGSPNDLPTVVKVRDTLTELGITSEIIVASAHRTPDKVFDYLDRAHNEGVQVLIGCAGMAAHLAGVIAGHTRLPVIGLPLCDGLMTGLDSPSFNRADAAGGTGCHRGHGWSPQCRHAGGADSGAQVPGN